MEGTQRSDRIVAITTAILFVTPVLVLASLGFGSQPMDLVCFPGLVLTVFFAVFPRRCSLSLRDRFSTPWGSMPTSSSGSSP